MREILCGILYIEPKSTLVTKMCRQSTDYLSFTTGKRVRYCLQSSDKKMEGERISCLGVKWVSTHRVQHTIYCIIMGKKVRSPNICEKDPLWNSVH